MKLVATWRELVQEEDGLATFVTGLFMATGLLLTMTIFIQIISEHGYRSFSLNAARSASDAGAKTYALRLSTVYPPAPVIGVCNEPRASVHQRAVALYQAYYPTQVAALQLAARADASQFAQANYALLDQSRFTAMISGAWPEFFYQHSLTGAIFQPTLVKGRTTKNYTSAGGLGHAVPAYAAAVAYLDEMEASVDYFFVVTTGYYTCTHYVAQYRYDWLVASVNEDR